MPDSLATLGGEAQIIGEGLLIFAADADVGALAENLVAEVVLEPSHEAEHDHECHAAEHHGNGDDGGEDGEDPREGAAEEQHGTEQESQAAEGTVVALARGRQDVDWLDAGREGERAGVDDRLGGEAELGEEHERKADKDEVHGNAEHRADPRQAAAHRRGGGARRCASAGGSGSRHRSIEARGSQLASGSAGLDCCRRKASMKGSSSPSRVALTAELLSSVRWSLTCW
jgi:hypothetical protein